ncbi:hypothetical protein PPERSA_00717 [Pseudocohnilembus persalinus]|uniref:Uncharacterized protein n=1 Tax=Pseudocohnilembus persalinus TaxID=266149 RepID=A0A0V0Q880_PSEPJ|nr:hypothetical protein PPERSA_00717 [Pseudocohnilembus persalinus]|eukprot:KRW98260.1 hypothetical protein PPERSA_00717 [Pseudocohnilembus persalinus]
MDTNYLQPLLKIVVASKFLQKNVINPLQKENKKFNEERKSNEQKLEELNQELWKKQEELSYINNQQTGDSNQDYNESEKLEINLQKEIEQLQNLLQKENQQTVDIFIYEGPIQKLNVFSKIIEDKLYIVDMPGFDSNNPIIEKFVQNMLKQQNNTIFTQTKIFSLICDPSSLTKKSFIDKINEIARNNNELIEKMNDKDEVYKKNNQEYIHHDSQEDFKNYFLTVNKIDDNQKEDELNEIINNSNYFKTNENLKNIIDKKLFKISAQQCFQKDILTGNLDNFKQLREEKEDLLRNFLKNQQNWKFIESICINKEGKQIIYQNKKVYKSDNFKEFEKEFYEVIYNKEQQKEVANQFQDLHDGISDFLEKIIFKAVQLHINNTKLQICEILNMENIFIEVINCGVNSDICQQIIKKLDYFLNQSQQEKEQYKTSLNKNQENFLKKINEKFNSLIIFVKKNEIQDCQSKTYLLYMKQFKKDSEQILKQYLDQQNEIVQEYQKKVNNFIISIQDLIPDKLHSSLVSKFKLLQNEYQDKFKIQNPDKPLLGITSFISIVSLLGGVGTGFLWALRVSQVFFVASSFSVIGLAYSTLGLLITSGVTFIFKNLGMTKKIEDFLKQLELICTESKQLIKSESENSVNLEIKEFDNQNTNIKNLKVCFELLSKKTQDSSKTQKEQTDNDNVNQNHNNDKDNNNDIDGFVQVI